MANIGQAVGNFLGFDPTPGFNVRNPFGKNNAKGWGQNGGGFIGPTGGGLPKTPSYGTYKTKPSGGGGGGNVQGAVDTGGGGGGGAPAGPDPAKVDAFNRQYGNIFGSGKEAAQNAFIGRKSSILDFLGDLRGGQQAIDERGVQNELAKRQGSASIMDMVGRGIRSGGVMLAGKNATDSSAAEQLARAYGDIGQRELSQVGNQYELENRNIGLAQDDFERQRKTGLRKFDEEKQMAVNNIVSEARNSLAELDAAMVDADIPTKVQLERDKQRIKQQAINILGQFDQELGKRASGIRASGRGERARTAADLANRGVAATNPFDFTTQTPANLQGTGPFASELPLFSLRNLDEQEV